MRKSDLILMGEIEQKLISFNKTTRIPGVRTMANRKCLSRQIVDSIRRVKYVTTIRDKVISKSSTDATLDSFNPLKAAVWHKNNGNTNEAFWLVFLATHFGKNRNSGWQLVRNVYSELGSTDFWTWERIKNNSGEFIDWVEFNCDNIKYTGKFSNHRKYESINQIGKVVSTYLKWVGEEFEHQYKIETATEMVGQDPNVLFDHLYQSMEIVFRFGRTAKFDYLTMVGKLGLAEIEPGYTYMKGATGPLTGARILFGKPNLSVKEIEELLSGLNNHLGLFYGMQVLEDSICNWQKDPSNYKYFAG